MRFRENIVIVVVAMKGVLVDGRTVARGCEKAFFKKYTETSVKRYVSFFRFILYTYTYMCTTANRA